MNLTSQQINTLLKQVNKASAAILDIYQSADLEVKTKKDNSPLTLADRTSHDILVAELKKLYPDIPIISEEGASIAYQVRKSWQYFWVIDPLDGTKEFISGNGEFTINLALVQSDQPIFGIVAAPTKDTVYFANQGSGAYKKENNNLPQPIKANKKSKDKIIVARTRSHKNEKEELLISKLGQTETIHAGSALKFCLVAEGKADIYLRGGPTMEWDTAAGDCIAAEAGATTYTIDGKPFLYNKESLLNPGLICTANPEIINKLGISFVV
ncbi:MAG: 3'(2'),5'-bisphosphate nucleotidase CysQ [Candidatus Omnitrophica bacterium]|nr:3'(2'),5'-bisphosphate nucleotidase CysQ [Candidatus Omnitrophota bacterium]MCF7895272.1 3'(2'),5'-bisphosphate nucleotidase CysQ [Candidatus Omnitrophota bacterium]